MAHIYCALSTITINLVNHFDKPMYRPDIDGLRAVAVLSVVAFHVFPDQIKGGFVGVDIFFVISGYLITQIILSQLNAKNFSFYDFYSRRIRRIFPSLILIFLTCYVFGWFTLLSDDFKQLGKHIASGSTFISNLILWNESGYFDSSSDAKPLLHLWSLGIEEQFYIVWPFFLWAIWKSKLNPLFIIVTLAITSFVLNLSRVNQDAIATFYAPETRFWELLSGAILAWITLNNKLMWVQSKYKTNFFLLRILRFRTSIYSTINNFISLAGLALLIFSIIKLNRTLAYPGAWAALPVIGTILMIVAGPNAWFNRYVLSSWPAVWIGLISFPLYLWHWPILVYTKIISIDLPSFNIRILIITLSVFLAWLTYKFIEMPIRFGKNMNRKMIALVALILIGGSVGFYTYISNGFGGRPIEKHFSTIFPPEARGLELELRNSYHEYYGLESSTKPMIIVIGDSNIPNWSVAISHTVNLEKYDLLAVSYLGCNVSIQNGGIIATPFNKEYIKNCYSLETHLNDPSKIHRANSIMLASHQPFKYGPNSFRFKLMEYLHQKTPSAKLIIFGDYFQLNPDQFPSCEKLMQKTLQNAMVCIRKSNYTRAEDEIKTQPLYPSSLKFSYIDLRNSLCSSGNESCPFEYKKVPFMIDSHHLTAAFLMYSLPAIFRNSDSLKQYID